MTLHPCFEYVSQLIIERRDEEIPVLLRTVRLWILVEPAERGLLVGCRDFWLKGVEESVVEAFRAQRELLGGRSDGLRAIHAVESVVNVGFVARVAREVVHKDVLRRKGLAIENWEVSNTCTKAGWRIIVTNSSIRALDLWDAELTDLLLQNTFSVSLVAILPNITISSWPTWSAWKRVHSGTSTVYTRALTKASSCVLNAVVSRVSQLSVCS